MKKLPGFLTLAPLARTPHAPPMLQLAQNQLWKQGDRYFRIVVWERLAIRYKEMDRPDATEGTMHDVSKKEFCRLIKGAELVEGEPPSA